MSAYVPTLSRSAWSKTPAEKIDFLLSDYFTSEASQSTLYASNIHSITELIQVFQNDIPGLVSALRSRLNEYLRVYFDDTIVDVSTDANSIENPTSLVNIFIYVQVTDNGVVYTVNKLVEMLDSNIKRIINYNNTGNL